MLTDATTTDRLLTVTETAERLRCSRTSIYRKVATGDIPAVRLAEHGPLRISADDLERWLDARRTDGTP
jgi:excisionase family DNA binding protein